MPSVCVGNVGQLTIDVLITTLKASKAAIVHHETILPLIGHNAYEINCNELTTASDLWICEDLKVALLQIRSPIISEEKTIFLQDLVDWIEECKFSDIIIISAYDASCRIDSQIQSCQFRYLPNWISHPELKSLQPITKELEGQFSNDASHRKVPGGGFLEDLLKIKCGIPMVGLIKFVDEGDNTQDAFKMCQFLNSWKKYKEDAKWKTPFSWKYMFGPPAPFSLY